LIFSSKNEKKILELFDNIEKFVDGITYEQFTDNLEKVYAVAKAFENIGEAVKQLPKDVTSEYKNIPWNEIAKMRDVLTHHYFGVDDKVLWDTLDEDFKAFKSIIIEILSKHNN
jgi:uncharacterized protein with HEPN domain